jgi:hypothetical protein
MTSPTDPLAPFRAAASPEQRAALAEDDLAAIETAAREDKVAAIRGTARPWKWWTANSQRELRSEAGRRSYPVAHGQQHPYDRVIDIAIQEPDMALIERAVNGLEERADALVRLTAEVRRLRESEARLTHERNALGQAILEAALKAGIYSGVPVTGPELILLAQEMAEVIVRAQTENGR